MTYQVLDALLRHLSSIWTIVSGVFGAGVLVGLIEAYQTFYTQKRKGSQQDHDQDIELSEHLEARLTKVNGRLDAAEKELRDTKQNLNRSRIREEEMRAAIDALVGRVDHLIDRLEKHEQISEEEKDRLTSVPHIDSNKDT